MAFFQYLFQFKVNFPCCKATFGVCDLYFTSDLDLTFTSNQSTSQYSSTGDGCFSSLFDCMLMKLHEEAVAKGDLEALKSLEDTRPADVHSHLLAGLLGQKPEHVSSVVADTNLEGDIIEVPDTPEVEKKCYKRLKQHRSQVPLLSHSVSSLTTSLRASGDIDDNMDTDQDESWQNGAQIIEKDVFVKKSEEHTYPPNLVESALCMEHHESIDGRTSPESVNKQSPLKKLESCMDESKDGSSFSSFVGINSSFIAKLEEYSDTEKQDKDEPGNMEDFMLNLEKDVDRTGSPLHVTVSSESEINSTGVHTQVCSKADDTAKLCGTGNKQPYTPLRNVNENVPVHLQSPFVKKIPTDRVTKRKSRMKRKRETKDQENKESDMMYAGNRTGYFELDSSSDML